jgi:uncharacterized LabA/DUF88 family protein
LAAVWEEKAASGRFFRFLGPMVKRSKSLRTCIYVDGYNLYYGRLYGTEYKWLDVVALFSEMVRTVQPVSQVVAVKFFTAPALARFATHGNASMQAQNEYHRALASRYPALFEVVLGTHTWEPNGTALPAFVDGQSFDKTNTVRVWRIVEKKTDVNLALSMYRDASKAEVEQVVLVSNDSDAEPALRALTQDFPNLKVGVVMPLREVTADGKKGRPASRALQDFAHWCRTYIRDDELQRAQLPPQVPTRKKPARKPAHW